MNAFRIALAIVFAAVFAGPLLLPILRIDSFGAWRKADRIVPLIQNTFGLFLLTSLLAIPLGLLWAILLERVKIFAAGLLRFGLILSLFLPLPVYAVAWQIILGSWLPPLSLEPGEIAWRPWNQGLLPAAWVHGMAGAPWVALIAMAVLRWSDPALEEEARLLGGRRAVWRNVIFPRLTLATFASAAWLFAQTSTEITVTDAMMVRTFAEEAYTQMVIGGPGIAGALSLALPVGIFTAGFGVFAARRWGTRLFQSSSEFGQIVPVQKPSLIFGAIAWLITIVLVGLPLAALFWQAADRGANPSALGPRFAAIAKTDGVDLGASFGAAIVSGIATAGLAWGACWAALHSHRFRIGLFFTAVLLAATPGPILGFGLKETFRVAMDAEEYSMNRTGIALSFPPMRSLLYDQPSPVPAIWASILRYFPLACAAVWPAMRAIPKSYFDQIATDGGGILAEFRMIMRPFAGKAFALAAFAVAGISLGEVSAAKIANPPFYNIFILRVFDQMHYGTESTVAALALFQAIPAAVLAGFVARELTTNRFRGAVR